MTALRRRLCRNLVVLCALLASATAAADRPRICLVLSGGGARGVAHIGVLKVLEEYRVPIDCVVGTSMGAIVGGAYAAGMSPADIQEVVRGTQWDQVLSDDPPRAHGSIYFKELERGRIGSAEAGIRDGSLVLPTGAVTGQYLGTFLQHMVRSAILTSSFDSLPIPFRALATDIETGEMVVLADGELSNALRASMSVPGVFAPYDVNGRVLIDGGLVRNLGVDVARSMGAEVVIAVNLGTPLLRRESLGSLIGVATQTLNILTEQNVQRSIAELGPRDVLISPELGTFGAGEFQKALETVPLGEAAARKNEARLRTLALSEAEYSGWLAQRRRPAGELELHAVRVDTSRLKRVDPGMVAAIVADHEDERLTSAELDRKITALLNTNDFQTIDVDLTAAARGYDVTLTPVEKSWGPNYLHAGIALGSDLNGESAFDLMFDSRMTWLTKGGLEWRNRASIGDHTALRSELRQPLDSRHSWFVAPYLSFEQEQIAYFVAGDAFARYRNRHWLAGAALGRELPALGELRVGYERGHASAHRIIGLDVLPDFTARTGAVRAALVLDTYDNLDFPRSGYLVDFDALVSRPWLGSSDPYERVSLGAEWAAGNQQHSITLGVRHVTSLGSTLPLYDSFELGGFLSMSGLKRGQILASQATLLRLVYRRQIATFARLLPGIYVGGSAEYADIREALDGLDQQRYPRRHGGSLFVAGDTALGPLYLGTGYTEGGDLQFYLYVGRPTQ